MIAKDLIYLYHRGVKKLFNYCKSTKNINEILVTILYNIHIVQLVGFLYNQNSKADCFTYKVYCLI